MDIEKRYERWLEGNKQYGYKKATIGELLEREHDDNSSKENAFFVAGKISKKITGDSKDYIYFLIESEEKDGKKLMAYSSTGSSTIFSDVGDSVTVAGYYYSNRMEFYMHQIFNYDLVERLDGKERLGKEEVRITDDQKD